MTNQDASGAGRIENPRSSGSCSALSHNDNLDAIELFLHLQDVPKPRQNPHRCPVLIIVHDRDIEWSFRPAQRHESRLATHEARASLTHRLQHCCKYSPAQPQTDQEGEPACEHAQVLKHLRVANSH